MPVNVLLEVYELRRVLESHAAAQAAAKAGQATLEELESIPTELEATDGDEASPLDARFHGTIARASGNAALSTMLEVFRTRSRDYQLFDLPQGPAIKEESDRGHRRILDGVRGRDPSAAARAAGAHVAQTEQWLRELRPHPRPRSD